MACPYEGGYKSLDSLGRIIPNGRWDILKLLDTEGRIVRYPVGTMDGQHCMIELGSNKNEGCNSRMNSNVLDITFG